MWMHLRIQILNSMLIYQIYLGVGTSIAVESRNSEANLREETCQIHFQILVSQWELGLLQ